MTGLIPGGSFCVIDFVGNLRRTETPRRTYSLHTSVTKRHFQVWLPLLSTLSSQGNSGSLGWRVAALRLGSWKISQHRAVNLLNRRKIDGQRKPPKLVFLQFPCAYDSPGDLGKMQIPELLID